MDHMIAYLATLLTVLAPAFVPATGSAGPKPAPQRIGEIRIDKSEHRLDLMVDGAVYKSYRVAIGPGGLGPKRFEWDMITPVGTYRVSQHFGIFHRFLHINYPNADDRVRYARLLGEGKVPAGRGIGDSIGIHGTGSPSFDGIHKQSDWTAGCVALDDAEIDEIAALAPVGTRVVITD